MRATWYAHLMFLEMICLVILGEECELWSSMFSSLSPLIIISIYMVIYFFHF
jgi:hypothetical protein